MPTKRSTTNVWDRVRNLFRGMEFLLLSILTFDGARQFS